MVFIIAYTSESVFASESDTVLLPPCRKSHSFEGVTGSPSAILFGGDIKDLEGDKSYSNDLWGLIYDVKKQHASWEIIHPTGKSKPPSVSISLKPPSAHFASHFIYHSIWQFVIDPFRTY